MSFRCEIQEAQLGDGSEGEGACIRMLQRMGIKKWEKTDRIQASTYLHDSVVHNGEHLHGHLTPVYVEDDAVAPGSPVSRIRPSPAVLVVGARPGRLDDRLQGLGRENVAVHRKPNGIDLKVLSHTGWGMLEV